MISSKRVLESTEKWLFRTPPNRKMGPKTEAEKTKGELGEKETREKVSREIDEKVSEITEKSDLWRCSCSLFHRATECLGCKDKAPEKRAATDRTLSVRLNPHQHRLHVASGSGDLLIVDNDGTGETASPKRSVKGTWSKTTPRSWLCGCPRLLEDCNTRCSHCNYTRPSGDGTAAQRVPIPMALPPDYLEGAMRALDGTREGRARIKRGPMKPTGPSDTMKPTGSSPEERKEGMFKKIMRKLLKSPKAILLVLIGYSVCFYLPERGRVDPLSSVSWVPALWTSEHRTEWRIDEACPFCKGSDLLSVEKESPLYEDGSQSFCKRCGDIVIPVTLSRKQKLNWWGTPLDEDTTKVLIKNPPQSH
jgi:hypothetical protein